VTRSFRGTALAFVCLLAAAGCSSGSKTATEVDAPDDRPTVAVTAQSMDPQEARVTVEQSLNLLAGSDWAGEWTLWTDASQAQLPQQAYVDLLSTCPVTYSRDFSITDVKASDPKTVVVKWTQAKPDNTTAAGQTTVVYEDGVWHVLPDPAALAAYKAGHCA
jgi:hypothetical protein